MPPVPRSPRDRLEAAYYTGPIGHFIAGALDVTTLLSRYLLARARQRVRRARGSASGA